MLFYEQIQVFKVGLLTPRINGICYRNGSSFMSDLVILHFLDDVPRVQFTFILNQFSSEFI